MGSSEMESSAERLCIRYIKVRAQIFIGGTGLEGGEGKEKNELK